MKQPSPIKLEELANPNEVGKRLRHLRESVFNESRSKFADRLGVPPTTLKNYELGYRELTWAGALSAIVAAPSMGPWITWLLKGSVEQPNQRDPVTKKTSNDILVTAIEYIESPHSITKEHNRKPVLAKLQEAMA